MKTFKVTPQLVNAVALLQAEKDLEAAYRQAVLDQSPDENDLYHALEKVRRAIRDKKIQARNDATAKEIKHGNPQG